MRSRDLSCLAAWLPARHLVLYSLGSGALADMAALVIFARIWRLVRIGHGVYTTGSETGEAT